MAIIAVPPGIRSIEWQMPERLAFAVTSGWTGSRTVGDLGGTRTGWRAQVTVVPGRPDHARAWRAFFSALRGPVNSFLLDPSDGNQRLRPMPKVLVAGAGQTGTTLNVDGALANLPMLVQAGDVVSIEGRGYVVQAPVGTSSSGTAALMLEPPIVKAPADDAEVLIYAPRIEMALEGGALGWLSEPGIVTRPFEFACVEVLP